MSRRLALDFDTTVCNGKTKQEAEQNQMNQVERHMRVCLGVKEGLDSAVTVAASEPQSGRGHRHAATWVPVLSIIAKYFTLARDDQRRLWKSDISIDTLYSLMFEDRQLKSLSV